MPKRKWTIFVINHSHTDIGFTAEQNIIKLRHVNYIRKVIEMLSKESLEGYKWNCETFWSVEEFLKKAQSDELKQFIKYVIEGKIGLSASYLNFTELLDYKVLNNLTKRAVDFSKENSINLETALTADINGYSWGFSEILYSNGIKNLYSCTHSHHGMFPIGRRQFPFYWKTPKENKVLVWNGDHYMFGNDLGIGPIHGKFIDDELDLNQMEPFSIAEVRIPRYLEKLEEENYPFDFVPITVSGKVIDNAPPNENIIKMIKKWNKSYGDKIFLKMVTIDEVFQKIRNTDVKIPVYSGDWPDWWTDGVISTARTTSTFRLAQRKLKYYRNLLDKYNTKDDTKIRKAEKLLGLYAEHTWGHHQSVSHPYLNKVNIISETKKQYATQAYNYISKITNELLISEGILNAQLINSKKIKIVNPMPFKVNKLYKFPISESIKNNEKMVGIINKKIPKKQYFDKESNSLFMNICVEAKKTKTIDIQKKYENSQISRSSFDMRGNVSYRDKSGIIVDTELKSNLNCKSESGEHFLETPYVKLEWEKEKGITKWFDKKNKISLLSDERVHNPFTPIYEMNPAKNEEDIIKTRVSMGRNRKNCQVNRFIGKFTGLRSIKENKLFTEVELKYSSPGLKHYLLKIRAYHYKPQADCTIRFLKTCNWEAENLYISLPFSADSSKINNIFLHKTGGQIEPWKDQLPGTLTDFYCVQEGFSIITKNSGITVATPDTPIIHIGDLKYRNRLLKGSKKLKKLKKNVYAWALSNYWETNFKAEIGGFYQFEFLIKWSNEFNDAEKSFLACKELNTDLPYFEF
ncbi:glycoside hydrolase family 38 N-terminal domain-containing protein [Halanaerobium kushneri]|uniref:Glycosyl hydrolases family 38 N-terminal domain-containing protein n=1 Tax=Halanaerobium kushneri TaxID=56779 RepID=A0A1N6R0U4_9FIRM|nr:hypothetical protein [Halanaerobium kushneri]SIQ22474.1 Glycosyl hydrolases family 38 N-terminal domain-containing protein [Halanaerobium kushneri]